MNDGLVDVKLFDKSVVRFLRELLRQLVATRSHVVQAHAPIIPSRGVPIGRFDHAFAHSPLQQLGQHVLVILQHRPVHERERNESDDDDITEHGSSGEVDGLDVDSTLKPYFQFFLPLG